jgi:polysaccharide export outer membrane protein
MKFMTLFGIAAISLGFLTAAQAQRQDVPNPVSKAYGDSEFRLGPDDVLEITVYQDKELSRPAVPVRPDGKISVPLIGDMVASGKTAAELEKEIAGKYKQFIAEPAVSVVVKEVNSPKVSVLGEVKNPGMYKIKDRATVLDAIALAGGLTEYAKKDKVSIFRPEPSGEQRVLKINLEDQIKGRRTDPFYVLPYDKIYIP